MRTGRVLVVDEVNDAELGVYRVQFPLNRFFPHSACRVFVNLSSQSYAKTPCFCEF
jgi:hypothetical protein